MAEEKGDLSRLKIAKKTYVFDTRRKFAASRSFAVKKKPGTPAEEIKQKLTEMFSKKGGMGSGKPQSTPDASAQPGGQGGGFSGTTRTVLIVLAVIFLFVVAGGLYVGYMVGSAPPEAPKIAKPDVFSGYYDYSVGKSEIISVAQNDRIGRSAYLLVNFQAANLTWLNMTANVYPERPITQVFLLDYAREGADSYPVFRKSFLSDMEKAGMMVNEIDVEHVASVPGGAAIVVPTGYMPEEFVGMGSSFDYMTLLSRGVSIIYIGRPFDTTVLDRSGTTGPSSATSYLNFNRLTRTRLDSTDGFRLFDAQYTAGPNDVGGQMGLYSSGQIYGSVSVVRKGAGSLVMLPVSLDGGWGAEGGQTAAEDVVRLLREERWVAPSAAANISAPTEAGAGSSLSIFTSPFDSDSAYVKLSVEAVDYDGAKRRSVEVLKVVKATRGEMTPRDLKILPSYLSGQRNRLNIKLQETDPTPVELFIRMYKDETQLQQEKLEVGQTNPTTEKTNDFPVNAEPGSYVVRVEDAANKVYAACELDVVDINVDVQKTDWAKGAFTLALSSQYGQVNPKYVSISLDGKGERRYSASSVSYKDGVTTIEYDYPSGQIAGGNHTLTLTSGDTWKREIPLNYRPPKNFWDNPLVLILGFLSLSTFAIGWILRKPDTLRYGLDIPDFPPLSTIKIPVKPETVLEIFESVNASYSWQYMPLRVDEIKTGFRRLTYNGKPILIGDFNLERILAKLKERGLVKDELGYWGKLSWETESHHSIHYLTIYRIMRNVFVNNAVKFSKLDAMADCDVKAVAGKDEIYLHIMEEPYERVIHRALATSKKGTTLIVFNTEEAVESFRDSLTSTSRLAVGLKMEVNAGSILLVPVKNAISAYLKQTSK